MADDGLRTFVRLFVMWLWPWFEQAAMHASPDGLPPSGLSILRTLIFGLVFGGWMDRRLIRHD